MNEKVNLYNNLSEYICIYGAGQYGKITNKYLKMKNINVICFLISDSEKNFNNYDLDLPIYKLSEAPKEFVMRACIYVTVKERLWDEIKKNILEVFPHKKLENIRFISETDIFKMIRFINPVDTSMFLESTMPVSNYFGFDRGMPIDRYYIEKFLVDESNKYSKAVKIFEVGTDEYSKRYFPSGVHEILDYNAGMDLTNTKSLKKEFYDIFICTQVFNFIYDVRAAIQGAYYVLKKDGVLLATVAGNICQVSETDMKNYGDYWRFTYLSVQKLFNEIFGEENVRIMSFGNSMAATAFIQGIAVEELPNSALLDEVDANYAICIGIVAKRMV